MLSGTGASAKQLSSNCTSLEVVGGGAFANQGLQVLTGQSLAWTLVLVGVSDHP